MTQLHEGRTFEQLLEMVERVQPCPCVDSLGQNYCNRPATVYRPDIECHVCPKCDKEMP